MQMHLELHKSDLRHLHRCHHKGHHKCSRPNLPCQASSLLKCHRRRLVGVCRLCQSPHKKGLHLRTVETALLANSLWSLSLLVFSPPLQFRSASLLQILPNRLIGQLGACLPQVPAPCSPLRWASLCLLPRLPPLRTFSTRPRCATRQ